MQMYPGNQSHRIIVRDKIMPEKERRRLRKERKQEKQNLFSFNQATDGALENRAAILHELMRQYPHGDLTKNQHERNFKNNTPRGKLHPHSEYRRADVYTKVKGVPRDPFIPTHEPLLTKDGIPIDDESDKTSTVGVNPVSKEGTVLTNEELSKNSEDWIKE